MGDMVRHLQMMDISKTQMAPNRITYSATVKLHPCYKTNTRSPEIAHLTVSVLLTMLVLLCPAYTSYKKTAASLMLRIKHKLASLIL